MSFDLFIFYYVLTIQNRDEAHRLDQHPSSSGHHMGPAGSRSSTVLPDLLSQV